MLSRLVARSAVPRALLKGRTPAFVSSANFHAGTCESCYHHHQSSMRADSRVGTWWKVLASRESMRKYSADCNGMSIACVAFPGPVRKEKQVPADVSLDGPLIRYGLNDWKLSVPLGMALSVPFLANEVRGNIHKQT